MKKLIITFLTLFMVSNATAADFMTKNTPVKENSVCISEEKASVLLGVVESCTLVKEENKALNTRVTLMEEMNATVQKQADLYKKAYEDMKVLTDDQIKLTKQSTEQCKEMLKQAKPTMLEDAGKIGIGVLIGVGLMLLLL